MRGPTAVLVPGWNGSRNQPILVRLARELEARGIAAARTQLEKASRPSPDYEAELKQLETAIRRARPAGPLALVGRSFGGRICAFYAVERPPSALVLLGHPIRPEGGRRERDEEALLKLRCPTLIVQGDADPLGPLEVLEPLAAQNGRVTLHVLEGCGHSLREVEAARVAADWLAERLRRVKPLSTAAS